MSTPFTLSLDSPKTRTNIHRRNPVGCAPAPGDPADLSLGSMSMSNKKPVTCDECGGTGILEDDECPYCLGEGRIEVDEDETWEQSEDIEEIEDDFDELLEDEIGDEEDLY